MNFSRKELIETDATMNQMRNAIYVLTRLMEKNGVRDSKDRLRRMGRDIARTYINYWKPTDIVTLNNIKDVIDRIVSIVPIIIPMSITIPTTMAIIEQTILITP